MQWLCDLFKTPVKTGEIAPGIPRPSYILAGLICTEILKNPREAFIEDLWNRNHSKSIRYKWTSKSREAVIEIQATLDKDYHSGEVTGVQSLSKTIKWETRNISDVFHQEDVQLILHAIKKSSNLRASFIKEEEEALKQQIACDLIEQFTLKGTPK